LASFLFTAPQGRLSRQMKVRFRAGLFNLPKIRERYAFYNQLTSAMLRRMSQTRLDVWATQFLWITCATFSGPRAARALVLSTQCTYSSLWPYSSLWDNLLTFPSPFLVPFILCRRSKRGFDIFYLCLSYLFRDTRSFSVGPVSLEMCCDCHIHRGQYDAIFYVLANAFVRNMEC
jgi:hypothetical protein